ncbi:hypothetical protein ABKN59_009686 [Abortiporus biennis]
MSTVHGRVIYNVMTRIQLQIIEFTSEDLATICPHVTLNMIFATTSTHANGHRERPACLLSMKFISIVPATVWSVTLIRKVMSRMLESPRLVKIVIRYPDTRLYLSRFHLRRSDNIVIRETLSAGSYIPHGSKQIIYTDEGVSIQLTRGIHSWRYMTFDSFSLVDTPWRMQFEVNPYLKSICPSMTWSGLGIDPNYLPRRRNIAEAISFNHDRDLERI